jgi:acyl carrier protein
MAVFEALRIGARSGFDDERRRRFLDEGASLLLADLDMDSLGRMEFCIAIELSTAVTLLPAQLAELGSTEAIEQFVRRKLAECTQNQQ